MAFHLLHKLLLQIKYGQLLLKKHMQKY